MTQGVSVEQQGVLNNAEFPPLSEASSTTKKPRLTPSPPAPGPSNGDQPEFKDVCEDALNNIIAASKASVPQPQPQSQLCYPKPVVPSPIPTQPMFVPPPPPPGLPINPMAGPSARGVLVPTYPNFNNIPTGQQLPPPQPAQQFPPPPPAQQPSPRQPGSGFTTKWSQPLGPAAGVATPSYFSGIGDVYSALQCINKNMSPLLSAINSASCGGVGTTYVISMSEASQRRLEGYVDAHNRQSTKEYITEQRTDFARLMRSLPQGRPAEYVTNMAALVVSKTLAQDYQDIADYFLQEERFLAHLGSSTGFTNVIDQILSKLTIDDCDNVAMLIASLTGYFLYSTSPEELLELRKKYVGWALNADKQFCQLTKAAANRNQLHLLPTPPHPQQLPRFKPKPKPKDNVNTY